LGQLREAFNEAKIVSRNSGGEGMFFEAYWHARISELAMDYDITVLRLKSEGKMSSTLLFKEKDQYWAPGIPIFPQIDAAIACNETLYAIQYTVQDTQKNKKKEFDVTKFSNEFLATIFGNNKALHDITHVIIVYVVPPYRLHFITPEPTEKQATVRSSALQFGEKVVSFKTKHLVADVNSDDVPDFPFLKKRGTNISS
jgi:hypothetical protein